MDTIVVVGGGIEEGDMSEFWLGFIIGCIVGFLVGGIIGILVMAMFRVNYVEDRVDDCGVRRSN